MNAGFNGVLSELLESSFADAIGSAHEDRDQTCGEVGGDKGIGGLDFAEGDHCDGVRVELEGMMDIAACWALEKNDVIFAAWGDGRMVTGTCERGRARCYITRKEGGFAIIKYPSTQVISNPERQFA